MHFYPEMYNFDDFYDDMNLKRGELVKVTFGKGLRVEKKFRGKTLKMKVTFSKRYGVETLLPYRILELREAGNKSPDDTIGVLEIHRLEGLLSDLFPLNRRPWYGYKQKTLKIERL